MEIHSDYELGQKVKMIPFDNQIARIEGIYYSYYGVKYYVSFYRDFKDENAYFFGDEIEAV